MNKWLWGGPDLCRNDCGADRFVYKWLWGGQIWGSVFHRGGSSYSTETPCALESHLQIVKIETPKILKREALFSEEKKPENHFFASKSFAIFIMTFEGLFGVRNGRFWTKRERYLHFLTLFDTFGKNFDDLIYLIFINLVMSEFKKLAFSGLMWGCSCS